MQRSVECPVCTEVYDTETKIPKSLSCGHGFCAPCLDTLLSGTTINCPKCRTSCDVPGGQASKLPTTFPILDVLETLCEECTDRPHTGKCHHCSQILCEICKKSHPEPGSDEVVELLSLEKLVMELTDKYTGNEDVDKITDWAGKLVDQVGDVRHELISKIEKWHQGLVSEIETKIRSITERYFEWQAKLTTELGHGKVFVNKSKLLLKNKTTGTNSDLAKDELRDMKRQANDKQNMLRNCLKLKPVTPIISLEYMMTEFETTLSRFSEVVCQKTPNYQDISHKCTSGMGRPACVCEHNIAGNVIVIGEEIMLFDKELNLLHNFGDDFESYGVAVNIDGNIYISDFCNHRIAVWDINGTELYSFGSEGSGQDLYLNPQGLAFDSQDLLYVCDSENHRVKVVDKHGKFVKKFGQHVFWSEKPRHISVSQEKVAVTDDSGNLYLFTTDGDLIRTTDDESTPHNIHYSGVAFDEQDNIIAIDQNSGRVVVITTTDFSHYFIQQPNSVNLCNPEGVCLTKTGEIIVCDYGDNRVQMFTVPYI